MAGRNIIKKITYLFSNILWINLRRIRFQLGWRVLIFFINTLFLFLFCIKLSIFIYSYVFLMVLFANILFILTRIQAEKDSILLLRSFGASKIFIILDHLFQILLQLFVAGIIFILPFPFLYIFLKASPESFLFFLVELLCISIITTIYSIKTINLLEKEANL